MWSPNKDIVLTANNNGAGMRGSDDSSVVGASAAATHPRLPGHPCLQTALSPAAPRGAAAEWCGVAAGPRRAPGTRRPRPGTAALRSPRRLREPCPGTPYLAPPWPSWPGTARQRKRRGGCRKIRAGGLSRPPGIGEGGKRAARRQRCPRTEPCDCGRQDWRRRGPRETPDARCSTP